MTFTRFSRSLLLVSSLTLFMGCEALKEAGQGGRMPTASEIEQYNASVPPEDQIVCSREKPTGSRIAQVTCRRAGTLEEISDLTQAQFQRVIR